MTLASRQRGVTLVELLVAMAMSATVLGGAVAAIGLSGRTFQSAANGIQSSNAIDGLAQISSDIQLALGFTERTATATTFWVPDRTGDGAPEQIRYAWSGTPGDPLTYSFNGSTAVEIIPAVERISLAYIVATVAGNATFSSLAGGGSSDIVEESVFTRAFSGTPVAVHDVASSASVAAIVKPVLPNGGGTFRITRVRIPMRQSTGDGDTIVTLHRVDMTTAVPQSAALSSTTIRKEELSTAFAEVEAELDSDTIFTSGDFIAIVVSSGGSAAAQIPLEASPQYFTDGWIATTGTLGTWGVNATRDMPITVYAEIDPEE